MNAELGWQSVSAASTETKQKQLHILNKKAIIHDDNLHQ